MRSGARRGLAAVVSGLWLTAALGQDESAEAPDLDFLEYLGSWQETDEEWLAVERWDGAPDRSGRSSNDGAAPDAAAEEDGMDR